MRLRHQYGAQQGRWQGRVMEILPTMLINPSKDDNLQDQSFTKQSEKVFADSSHIGTRRVSKVKSAASAVDQLVTESNGTKYLKITMDHDKPFDDVDGVGTRASKRRKLSQDASVASHSQRSEASGSISLDKDELRPASSSASSMDREASAEANGLIDTPGLDEDDELGDDNIDQPVSEAELEVHVEESLPAQKIRRPKGWHLRRENRHLLNVRRETPSATRKADTESQSPSRHEVNGNARRLPGRRRATHPDDDVETDLRRQLELKVAYRAAVKALKPVLAELAQRTEHDLENDMELHKETMEYDEVQGALDDYLKQRLYVLERLNEMETARLERVKAANEYRIRCSWEGATEDSRDELLARGREKMLEIIREMQAVGDEDILQDEKGSAEQEQKIKSEDNEESRLHVFNVSEELLEELDERLYYPNKRRKLDDPNTVQYPRGFARSDGGRRKEMARVLGAREVVEAADILHEITNPHVPDIANDQAEGLQALASAVELLSRSEATAAATARPEVASEQIGSLAQHDQKAPRFYASQETGSSTADQDPRGGMTGERPQAIASSMQFDGTHANMSRPPPFASPYQPERGVDMNQRADPSLEFFWGGQGVLSSGKIALYVPEKESSTTRRKRKARRDTAPSRIREGQMVSFPTDGHGGQFQSTPHPHPGPDTIQFAPYASYPPPGAQPSHFSKIQPETSVPPTQTSPTTTSASPPASETKSGSGKPPLRYKKRPGPRAIYTSNVLSGTKTAPNFARGSQWTPYINTMGPPEFVPHYASHQAFESQASPTQLQHPGQSDGGEPSRMENARFILPRNASPFSMERARNDTEPVPGGQAPQRGSEQRPRHQEPAGNSVQLPPIQSPDPSRAREADARNADEAAGMRSLPPRPNSISHMQSSHHAPPYPGESDGRNQSMSRNPQRYEHIHPSFANLDRRPIRSASGSRDSTGSAPARGGASPNDARAPEESRGTGGKDPSISTYPGQRMGHQLLPATMDPSRRGGHYPPHPLHHRHSSSNESAPMSGPPPLAPSMAPGRPPETSSRPGWGPPGRSEAMSAWPGFESARSSTIPPPAQPVGPDYGSRRASHGPESYHHHQHPSHHQGPPSHHLSPGFRHYTMAPPTASQTPPQRQRHGTGNGSGGEDRAPRGLTGEVGQEGRVAGASRKVDG